MSARWIDSDQKAKRALRMKAQALVDSGAMGVLLGAANFALHSPEAILARPSEFERWIALYNRAVEQNPCIECAEPCRDCGGTK